jgi:hypothetical protein
MVMIIVAIIYALVYLVLDFNFTKWCKDAMTEEDVSPEDKVEILSAAFYMALFWPVTVVLLCYTLVIDALRGNQ